MRDREERRPIQVLFEEERLWGDARLIVKDELPVSHRWHGFAMPAFRARNGISSQATDRQRK